MSMYITFGMKSNILCSDKLELNAKTSKRQKRHKIFLIFQVYACEHMRSKDGQVIMEYLKERNYDLIFTESIYSTCANNIAQSLGKGLFKKKLIMRKW